MRQEFCGFLGVIRSESKRQKRFRMISGATSPISFFAEIVVANNIMMIHFWSPWDCDTLLFAGMWAAGGISRALPVYEYVVIRLLIWEK